jgi:hypothetical protein
MTEEKNHTNAGDVKTIGHPVNFIKTPARVANAVSVSGQHSQ